VSRIAGEIAAVDHRRSMRSVRQCSPRAQRRDAQERRNNQKRISASAWVDSLVGCQSENTTLGITVLLDKVRMMNL